MSISSNRFLKNTAAISISKTLQPIFNFALSLAIGRILGVKIFGAYSTIFFLLTIFQMFSSFGLKPYVTREIAKNTDSVNKFFTNCMILIFPFTIINMFFINFSGHLMQYESIIMTPILILSASLVASGFADCLEGILEGLQKIQTIAFVWIIEQSIRIISSIILIYKGYGLNEICIVFVITRFLNAGLLFYFLNRFGYKLSWKYEYETLKDLLQSIKIFGPILIFVAFYWQIDSIIMSKILSLEDVGIYNAAFRIFRFFIIFVQSFIVTFYPVISNFAKSNRTKFENACKRSLLNLTLVLFPFVITISLFGSQIINLLWGVKYSEAGLVLQVLIWCILAYAVSKIFAYSFLAGDFQRYDLRVNIIGTIIKITLLILMIKFYGFLGAAIANIIAMIIYVLIQFPLINKHVYKIKFSEVRPVLFRLVLACISMILTGLSLSGINLVLAIVFSNVVYILIIWLNNVIRNEDKIMIRQFVKI